MAFRVQQAFLGGWTPYFNLIKVSAPVCFVSFPSPVIDKYKENILNDSLCHQVKHSKARRFQNINYFENADSYSQCTLRCARWNILTAPSLTFSTVKAFSGADLIL